MICTVHGVGENASRCCIRCDGYDLLGIKMNIDLPGRAPGQHCPISRALNIAYCRVKEMLPHVAGRNLTRDEMCELKIEPSELDDLVVEGIKEGRLRMVA